MSNTPEVCQELLKRIAAKRASINAFVGDVRPRSTRLMNISIISSAVAAALTAGPALGGESFADAVQRSLALPNESLVWRLLCFGAMIVSIVAAVSTNLNKSQEALTRLAMAEASYAELEGLQTLVEFDQVPVPEAVKLYQQYVAKIPFVQDLPTSASA